MVSSNVYSSLVEWLSTAMEKEFAATRKPEYKTKTLIGLGRNSKVWSSWIETLLTDLFEQFLCLDKEKRVLVGEDGATLYAYNGAFFEQIDVKAEKFMAELVKRTMRALKIGSMYVQKCPVDIAKSIVSTLTSSDEYLYKPDRRYIAFTNYIFDLQTGKPKSFNIKYNPYLVLDIEYKDRDTCYKEAAEKYGVGDNPCRLWDSKLTGKNNGNLPGIIPDSEIRDAFQQWCGSLLVDPDVHAREYVCYLVGPGANGKSVLANVISKVFGNEYFSHFTPRQLFKDSDRGANIAALKGKIANLCDDLSAVDVSGGDYKRFASGQAFEARVPYSKAPIQVYAPPMLCCANELPEQRDNSKGNERRQLILHTTTYSFLGDEQDTDLVSKLSTPEARLYVFHWIYEGYRKVMKNNGRIKLGQRVVDAINRVMASSNNMRRWWGERDYVAVLTPVDKDPRWKFIKSLYEDYVDFCKAEGSEARQRKDISTFLRGKGYENDKGVRRIASGIEYCVGKLAYDTMGDGEIICGA